MNLLLDLGNTRLKWCTLAGERLGHTHALDHHAGDFDLRCRRALAAAAAEQVWLADVAAPAAAERVLPVLRSLWPDLRQLGPPHSCPDLQLAYADPTRLGVDRWLCLLAACDRASLVVSCGTALTLDLIDATGRHHGGLIAASPAVARDALTQRASHLPAQSGAVAEFADNSLDALASGSVLAAVGLIERQFAVATDRLGAAPRLLLTGGGAASLLPWLRVAHSLRPQLLFEGMRMALRRA